MTCVLGLDVDQHTADLLVQLQLEDGDRYFESSKGKSREPTDEEVAFQLQEEDLKILSQILSDKRMAMSIANAVQSDGEIVAENQTTEENAARDRRLARDWTGDGGPVAVAVADSQLSAESSALDDEALYKLQIAYMFGLKDTQEKVDAPTTDTPTDEAESSKFAAKRTRPSSSLVHRCIACRNEIKPIDMINAPCDHEYCLSCLEGLFKASMIDESLFPPRCCGTAFDMENVRTMLKSDLIQDFERKQIEFESTNKTYCHSTVCSSFIPSSRIMGEVATCPDCELKTCTNCKSESHLDDCPRDTALQQLLLTAQENGWQRCHSCSRVIELNVGCNHMTCRCGAEFCYNCGVRWKECSCSVWDEARLLLRENRMINRAQHECGHPGWDRVYDPHVCERCTERMPHYTFQCEECALRVCRRCRLNRRR